MTQRRRDLLQALTMVQNHPAYNDQDILTITGCGMSDDEVAQHLEAQWSLVARYSNYGGNKRRLAHAA